MMNRPVLPHKTSTDNGAQPSAAAHESLARDRWQLLRRALLPSSSRSCNSTGSIHEFPGYRLLEDSQDEWSKHGFCESSQRLSILEKLTHLTVHISTNEPAESWRVILLGKVVDTLLALRAMDPTRQSAELTVHFICDSPLLPHYGRIRVVHGSGANERHESAADCTNKWWTQQAALDLEHAERFNGSGSHYWWKELYFEWTNDSVTKHVKEVTCYLRISWAGSVKATDYGFCIRPYGLAAPRPAISQGTRAPDTNGSGASLDPMVVTWVRERALPTRRQKFTATELMSHTTNLGIDNTGNVCVWDSSQTLAFVLAQHCWADPTGTPRVVVELGSGMAALSSLMLLTLNNHVDCPLEKPIQRVFITDGHADCIRNNRINLRLLEASSSAGTRAASSKNGLVAGSTPSVEIKCQKMYWELPTRDDDISGGALALVKQIADWTLIADCTHFEEYHGHLLWTSICCTAVGGAIWLCQPNRGQSLARFLDLVDVVNKQSQAPEPSPNPILAVSEPEFPILAEKHEQFSLHRSAGDCGDGGLNSYDPDRHRPRILILSKLRNETGGDLASIRQHILSRST
jgi:hypothetical protein